MTADPGTAPLLREAHAAFEAGQITLAEQAFATALDKDSNNVEARYFLAVIAYQSGRATEALARIERAVDLRPASADCHNLRGLALMALGRHKEATTALRRATACEPDFADAANNLGAALEALGRLTESEAAYREAIGRNPAYAQAHCNLGRVLLATGRPADAESASRQAIDLDPELADARVNLAVAQQRRGAIGAAKATVESALVATPQDSGLRRLLGVLRHMQGDLGGAEAALRQAIALQPDLAEAHDNLAGVLLDQGRADEAEASFARALDANPQDARAHSNLLLCRNYVETDPDALFAAHCDWATRHTGPIALLPPADNATHDRLRIGYLSGDFRRHSVAYFFEPMLMYRDRNRYETFCYANLENPDEVTARLKDSSDHWRWVAGLDDDRLAAQIRADEIDILVDLSGHSAGNRLLVLARRPAPVQATWLGYPNTTGLEAIDYRITDAVADPPGAERHATETLLRLDQGFLCYRPPEDAPQAAAPPAVRNGYVTFGSFNNFRKITPQLLEIWSKILRNTDNARLLLKARPLADPATVVRIDSAFEANGVDPARLDLRGTVASPADHLGTYGDIDIALDPFPYNGTTTTCEALWMGVPVVTLSGNCHAGRVGASLLGQIGLREGIASDRDGYVAAAVKYAGDINRLTRLRADLRHRMAESPLCDGPGFCRRMESAFERMWRERFD